MAMCSKVFHSNAATATTTSLLLHFAPCHTLLQSLALSLCNLAGWLELAARDSLVSVFLCDNNYFWTLLFYIQHHHHHYCRRAPANEKCANKVLFELQNANFLNRILSKRLKSEIIIEKSSFKHIFCTKNHQYCVFISFYNSLEPIWLLDCFHSDA